MATGELTPLAKERLAKFFERVVTRLQHRSIALVQTTEQRFVLTNTTYRLYHQFWLALVGRETDHTSTLHEFISSFDNVYRKRRETYNVHTLREALHLQTLGIQAIQALVVAKTPFGSIQPRTLKRAWHRLWCYGKWWWLWRKLDPLFDSSSLQRIMVQDAISYQHSFIESVGDVRLPKR